MRYRSLGRTGALVSELALGTGTFGTAWGWGAAPDEVQSILEGYAEAGGNFIDCAEGYQNGEAESHVGRFLDGRRDHFVIGTKFAGGVGEPSIATTGNSRKAMAQALEGSLRRLKTDRVDLFSVHFPDGITPVEEMMRGFEDLVRAGKAVYAGFSDFPAWRVARAATLAECRGWVQPAAIQIEYSLVERTAEREILPMAQALGLAVTIWLPLAGGLLTGKYRQAGAEGRLTRGGGQVRAEESARETAVIDLLQSISAAHNSSSARVALAWIIARSRSLGVSLIPILGARTRAQLDDNLGAVALELTADEVARLDSASAVSLGFPHEMLAGPIMKSLRFAGKGELVDAPSGPVA